MIRRSTRNLTTTTKAACSRVVTLRTVAATRATRSDQHIHTTQKGVATLSSHSCLAQQSMVGQQLPRASASQTCSTFANGTTIVNSCFSTHQSEAGTDVKKPSGPPLAGLKVLDLSRILAGPYCTMILGDLGAEIIKVEKPGTGDDTRTWGPPFCGKESVYFLTVNRNKKSIAIDIRTKEGQELIKQLAKQCDVLVENYIPGKLDEYKLSYRHLSQIAPQLIYCSISGYGQTGPYAQRAGYDVIVSGVGGLMTITGPENGEPCKVGVAMTDLSTGLYAHGAIMAAVLQRQITGRGLHIDCNLFSTQVASLINIGSNYLNAGMEARRHGTAHESIVPYQAFKTEDNYVLVGAGNDKQFKVLCKVLDLKHVLEDDRFTSNKKRVTNREVLLSILNNLFITKTTREWLDVFENSGIPYGPLNNMESVFSDPQALHYEMILEMNHTTAGKVRVPGKAVRYSDSKMKSTLPPPTLGQHTNEVLQQMLNLSDPELKQLRDRNIIE